jgi:predicted nucleic acid-binding protein
MPSVTDPVPARAVVLDTDVWSSLFVTTSRRGSRVDAWRRLLVGIDVVIATQTRAEALTGAFAGGWGARKTSELRAQLAATPTIPVDDLVVETYARLSALCKATGHALHQPRHASDRWVAASAIAAGLPLLSGDGIFEGAPGLEIFRGRTA